jgi:hypothetical protein
MTKIKKLSGLFLLLCLFIPLAQELFSLFNILPLSGSFDAAPVPVFSFGSWFDGSYQQAREKYANQNFGLRNFLVRLNNQLDYSLYKELHAAHVVQGKNGMLFGDTYITSYLGNDYMGEQAVSRVTQKLAAIQAKLQEKNKTLVVILAPGKGTFFSGDFPDRYKGSKKRNNHEEFSDQLQKKGVNTIDANTWFLKMKGRTASPLFTELGIHWTGYGASRMIDSLITYVEKKRNTDLPDYVTLRYETPDTLRPPDDDIYRTLNLLFTIPHAKVAYPVTEIREEPGKTKPSLLAVGDSYWWNIYNSGIGTAVFKEGRFWYYGKDAYPETKAAWDIVPVKSLKPGEIMDRTDVFVLCYTESTLPAMEGIVNDLHDHFCKDPLSEEKNRKIGNMMNYIRNDKVWMEGIKARSEKEKIPVDTLVLYDARWQVEHH